MKYKVKYTWAQSEVKAYLEVVGTPDLEVGRPRVPPEFGVQGVTPLLPP